MSVQDVISRQNDYCGITRWHNAGYKGQGIVVWNTEGASDHSDIVSRRILDSAPECTVIRAGFNMTSNNYAVTSNNVIHEGGTYSIEEFISKYEVNVVTRSIGGGTAEGKPLSAFWNNLKDKYNLCFFNSAGNDSTDDIGGCLPPDVAIWVGACNLVNGFPRRASYSSVGHQLDFMSFTGVWAGTSFATPYLAGQCALLKQFYGKDITQDEVYLYFMKHSYDLGTEGLDDFNGYGLVILGEPKMEVKMTIGSKTMYVDGVAVQIEQEPFIIKETGRTVAPVRYSVEPFGINVAWNPVTKEITLTK